MRSHHPYFMGTRDLYSSAPQPNIRSDRLHWGWNETDNHVRSGNLYRFTRCVTPVLAQQGITRMPLGTTDFPVGYQTVSNIAQVAAGLCFERHSHPGIESGYLLEGDLLLKIEGRPDQHLKAGDPMQIRQVFHIRAARLGD